MSTTISTISPGLAETYDATKTYAKGAYVLWQNAYWKCKDGITSAEAWTASHWTKVAKVLDGINNDLSGKIDAATRVYFAENDRFYFSSSKNQDEMAKSNVVILYDKYAHLCITSAINNVTQGLSEEQGPYVTISAKVDGTDTDIVFLYGDFDFDYCRYVPVAAASLSPVGESSLFSSNEFKKAAFGTPVSSAVNMETGKIATVDGSSGGTIDVTFKANETGDTSLRYCELLVTGVSEDGAVTIALPSGTYQFAEGADSTVAGNNHFIFSEYQSGKFFVSRISRTEQTI